MEFLGFMLFALAIAIAWLKPEKEGLAFGAFVAGTIVCFGMFLIASWTSVLPFFTY